MPNSLYRRFVPSGFHGDKYLQALVEELTKRSEVFIETGTNVGSTLQYVARTYHHLRCFSCEPNEIGFGVATKNLEGFDQVKILNMTSQNFIKYLKFNHHDLFKLPTLFWLDAHDFNYGWPLKEEVEFITNHWRRAYVLIDDFCVPGLSHKMNHYNFENIEPSINRSLKYDLYYPDYRDRTSTFHPLVYWCLIAFGDDRLIKVEKIRKV